MNRKGLIEAVFDAVSTRVGIGARAKQQHVMPSTGQQELLLGVMDPAQEISRPFFREKITAGYTPLDQKIAQALGFGSTRE